MKTENYTVYYSTGGHDSDRNKSRLMGLVNKCFMKKNSSMNKVTFFLLVIIAVIFIIISNNINRKKIAEIVSNSSYTIGTVQFYSSQKGAALYVPKVISSSTQPADVKFSYNVNGEKYTNRYDEAFFKMPSEGIQKGEQYLVIYNVRHPDKSLILFDYPIKNETDLDRYMEKFKTNPPDFKFK